MEVSSSSALINVKVGTSSGGMESVSRCPYRLSDLIHDQGLERVDAGAAHECRNTAEDTRLGHGTSYNDVQMAIYQLRETLDSLRQLRWMTS